MTKVENDCCGECGMRVPARDFHPYMYCLLFKQGIPNPAQFLEGQKFVPDAAFWGEDARDRQRAAARLSW